MLALVVATQSAGAWEAQTTQAGLAEQAALASRLHHRLTMLGFDGGLFEELTIPPADARPLIADLHLLSPTHGLVPDARGRQTALAWIAAGAALADVPASHGANHFYDPVTKRGWETPSLGLFGVLRGITVPEHGVPAPDWVVDNQNPFNLAGFLDQYGKAVTAATPGERSRAMAGALIAAGAMIHVLGDLGTPARVRGDYAAFLSPLGGGPADVGSRMERIAALVYGRLGVPVPDRTITRTHLRDYFTSPDGTGLADVIARSYFSPNTLPGSTRVNDAPPVLGRAQPALPTKLNLMAAGREAGTTLRNAEGTCLAHYRVEHSVITWSLDDDCVLEQLAVIMPEVAAYETGLLDFLLRGELAIAIDQGQVTISAKGLGAGTLDILVEDDRGVRTSIGTSVLAGGATPKDQLAKIAMPTYGTRVVAMFTGADQAGEPIVAVGALPLGSR
ncbi:MAG: hypothetical protein ABI467_09680 [Kofleriaceae bacterium]